MLYLLIFCSSVVLSIIFIYFISLFFKKIKLLDKPEIHGHKRPPIPYSLGIIFVFLFFILSILFVDHNNKLYLLWGFGFLITFVSFFDDFFSLNPKIRLLIQIIIGGIIGLTAIKVGYISGIFDGVINLDEYSIVIAGFKIYFISLIFSIIWYVFIFNSLNWSDGINGNTSGIAIISYFIILLLGIKLYYSDNYEGSSENAIFIIKIALILIGILIPFWYFSIKEKILMGDSGTMFLGFMLASLAIISGGKIGTVLIVFGIYSIDAIYVILRRIFNKQNPLVGDKKYHLHYRLLSVGLNKKQVLLFLYFFSLLFGLMSLFLDKIGKIIILLILLFFVIYFPEIIKKFKNNKKNTS